MKEIFRYSDIDSTIKVLQNLNAPYTLTTMGEVDNNPIRKLEYGKVVVLEKMVRLKADNALPFAAIIKSVTFEKGNAPLNWKIE